MKWRQSVTEREKTGVCECVCHLAFRIPLEFFYEHHVMPLLESPHWKMSPFDHRSGIQIKSDFFSVSRTASLSHSFCVSLSLLSCTHFESQQLIFAELPSQETNLFSITRETNQIGPPFSLFFFPPAGVLCRSREARR